MKTLYLARHAEAAPVGSAGIYHDFDRPLTAYGRGLLQQQAQALRKLAPDLQACYASPLLRTQQTATILVEGRSIPLESADCLGASPSFSTVQQLLLESSAEQILLVTHQPFVVNLLSWLLTGDQDLNTAFEPGTMACLEVYQLHSQPEGQLNWLLPAEMLAALG